jgi:hypothetical protein
MWAPEAAEDQGGRALISLRDVESEDRSEESEYGDSSNALFILTPDS